MNVNDRDQWQKDLAARINAADGDFKYEEDNALAEISELDTTWSRIKNMLKTNHLAMASLIVIIFFIVVAVLAPWITPCDPYEIDLPNRAMGPSKEHWLGTDEFGRDVLSRLMMGSRVSLIVGLVPTTLSMTIGVILGLTAGYIGGKVDFIIMRVADVALAFPSLLFAMLVSYTIGQNLLTIFIALSIISWAGTARVIRSLTLQLREKEFVEAAVSIGVKRSTIMFKHILPSALPSIIVQYSLSIGGSIMTAASLSFLGMGASPPTPEWGLLLSNARTYVYTSWHYAVFPGLAIFLTVLSFNLLGDAIREILDPKTRKR